MSDLVGNPEDRFSCVAAHIVLNTPDSLYPRHLCRRVYSFRFSVRPFVCSFIRSLVRFFVRNSGTFVEFFG